jgi:acyl-CoA synthetase (NDP forming)
MMLDQAEAAGLPLPELSNEDSPALRAALPEFVPVSNPLDVTAQGLVDPGIYGRTIVALVHDDRIGGILVNLIQTDVGTSHIKFTAVLEALNKLRPEKPVLVAGVDEGGGVLAEDIAAIREAGAMYLPTAERALRALARVSKAAEPSPAVVGSAKPLEGLPQSGTVAEYRSKALLGEYGIPFPRHDLARTVEDAVTVAERLGYPIVLKAQAADLAHKSDAGGVIVGLADAAAVREGWARLQANVSAARPDLTLDGVLVEKMGARGTELIVGARNDAHWGATLLVGFGGVTAELLHDVRLIPAGLSTTQIEAEIRGLRLAPLLDGYRGSPKLDVRAVADIVRKLGELVAATPAIKEIDLNPVVIYPEGEGAVALDALIYV